MRKLFSTLRRKRTGRDGFIVVAVLWILGALATLATIYAIYVVDSAMALTVHDERVQAEAAVTAGVELAVFRASGPPDRPSSRRFAFRIGRANIVVDVRSEAARIDLNAAPPALLAGLFTTLGARQELAEAYADRIVAWRSPIVPGNLDNEASAYRTAGLRYGPRHAPFPHTGELSLVLGLPQVLVGRALPFVTVYSGQAQINIFDAAPEVVAALPGMTPGRLQAVLAQREGRHKMRRIWWQRSGPAATMITSAKTNTMRVTVGVNFDNGRRMASEVVILLRDSGAEPYSVLSWRDLEDIPEDIPAGAR